jgi:hypothetical protein
LLRRPPNYLSFQIIYFTKHKIIKISLSLSQALLTALTFSLKYHLNQKDERANPGNLLPSDTLSSHDFLSAPTVLLSLKTLLLGTLSQHHMKLVLRVDNDMKMLLSGTETRIFLASL